ncbi:hypothetical protein J7L60_04955 [Candidatus Bathyarchaeota archaeon]|nr:hypothetical protein [Candidatus Bathyarchaeota archaeon]
MGTRRKAVLVFILLVVAIPLAYLGMFYVSATSAKYSISNVSLSEMPDPLEVLLSRQLDIELYLDIEGHGVLSVPVRSLNCRVYLEDIYVGNVRCSEPFRIPASGRTTAHLTFHLDLSSISLDDIQYIANSIISHNGEVKIGLDGQIEPVVLFFPITIPITYQVYTLTVSDAPKVSSLYWDSTSVAVGESVGFHITVENVFRGFSIDGVLDLIVREDVSFGSDVNARVYHFPVRLSPGESQTFSDSFVPYKKSSTRGFFLKARWGTIVLAEQKNKYPPRLSVVEGTLSLINVYWTVGGSTVTSCELGDEVVAHVVVKACNATVDDTLTIKIRKDLSLLPDEDVKVESFDVFLNKDESREYILAFTPTEASGGNLRGYFVEIEGDLSWTMPGTYPPRLLVNEEVPIEGTPSLENVWWTIDDQVVTEAQQGQTVKAHVQIRAVDGSVQGTVTVHIRKDLALLPDEDYKVQSFYLDLSEGQVIELTVTFSAAEKSGLSFRGYFVQVDFDSWGTSWTMDSAYPPRLKVN